MTNWERAAYIGMDAYWNRWGVPAANVKKLPWAEWQMMRRDGAFAGPLNIVSMTPWWHFWGHRILAYAITSLGTGTLGNGSGAYAVLGE